MDEHTKEKQKQYRLSHKDELKEKRQLYYQANKERRLAYSAQYRIDHPDKCKARLASYYERNLEMLSEKYHEKRKPLAMHKLMIKEFKSLYEPWNGEGCVDLSTSEIYHIEYL